MTDGQCFESVLRDAGAGEDVIERFRMLEARGEQETARSEKIRLLSGYRCKLMGELRACQKKVDCLDYLLYQLRGEQRTCTKKNDADCCGE